MSAVSKSIRTQQHVIGTTEIPLGTKTEEKLRNLTDKSINACKHANQQAGRQTDRRRQANKPKGPGISVPDSIVCVEREKEEK